MVKKRVTAGYTVNDHNYRMDHETGGDELTELEMAQAIALRVQEAGGCAYFVGGYVRDMLLGNENKDIDIEVHGITPDDLIGILSSLGEMTSFGESFGIFGLRNMHLDIAMPRSERLIGPGHRDFLCTLDPFIGTRQAALRRDFTINALMQNILTGEIVDHFGGQQDLKAHVIRHIDSDRFAEDPLRVLRGAQFAARFHFQIAPETIRICQEMDLSALAPERIFGELEKALLKSDSPSIFFEELRRMDQLDLWFPEVKALISVPQPPDFHPEGDVWNHTMMVMDEAAFLREAARNPIGLMLAALCHDLGKPCTTKTEADGRLHAYGHEKAGSMLAEVLLSRISNERKLKKYVKNMVLLHMQPNMLAAQSAGKKAFNRMYDRAVSPPDLLLLARADALGSCVSTEIYLATENVLRQRLQDYELLISTPGVTGNDLIAAGFHPSAAFHEALAYAHKLQLAGVDHKNALAQTIAFLHRKE